MSSSCGIKCVADALLMINKPVSVQPFKKVVLSMNFCGYANKWWLLNLWVCIFMPRSRHFQGIVFVKVLCSTGSHWLSIKAWQLLCIAWGNSVWKYHLKLARQGGGWLEWGFLFRHSPLQDDSSGSYYSVVLPLVVTVCLVSKPVDFWFWSLRLVSLELWRQLLGSKQVELWVIFQVFVFHCGCVLNFFFFLLTIKPPMGWGQHDWWPLKIRTYSGWWKNIDLTCKDLKKLKFGQTTALYMVEAILLFIF